MDEGGEGRRRAPEKSVLHEVFRRGWPEVSSLLPQRVKQEVERYLGCGEVRCGFVEVSCADCHESRLVAFSCKGRGWCPSCTTRRALETGAHLEAVLPRVAHRQWTLSLPRSVRFQVVKKPALLKRLEVRLVKAVWPPPKLRPTCERRMRHLVINPGLALSTGSDPQSDGCNATLGDVDRRGVGALWLHGRRGPRGRRSRRQHFARCRHFGRRGRFPRRRHAERRGDLLVS